MQNYAQEPHKCTGMQKQAKYRQNPPHTPSMTPTTTTTTTPTDCEQGALQPLQPLLQCSLTTSRAPWLSPSQQSAAYRQMHKEFNRVDLMRERKRNQGAHQCYGFAGQSGAADRSDRTTSTGQSSVSASSSQCCRLQQQQQQGQAGGRLQLRGRRRDHTLGDKLNFFFFYWRKKPLEINSGICIKIMRFVKKKNEWRRKIKIGCLQWWLLFCVFFCLVDKYLLFSQWLFFTSLCSLWGWAKRTRRRSLQIRKDCAHTIQRVWSAVTYNDGLTAGKSQHCLRVIYSAISHCVPPRGISCSSSSNRGCKQSSSVCLSFQLCLSVCLLLFLCTRCCQERRRGNKKRQ